MSSDGVRTAYEVLEVRDHASQAVIDAAFRALAAVYHPDKNGAAGAERRMAELNRAYALVRTAALREAYNRLLTPVGPGSASGTSNGAAPRAQAPRTGSDVLDFGRYVGWSLKDLARQDPDYLRWLSRHSSGIRYRHQIAALLATPRQATASDAVGGSAGSPARPGVATSPRSRGGSTGSERPPSASQHAAAWPPPTSNSGGSSTRQRSNARGQRG